jgi:hypothetical protein
MSITRWIAKATLVAALFVAAHSDAHAQRADRPMESFRRFEVHPEPKRGSFRLLEVHPIPKNGLVINWRTLRSAFYYTYTLKMAYVTHVH